MSIAPTPHEWSKPLLFQKAVRYVEEMYASTGDWKFGFWSSLALEMLIKAALANVSPGLLADGKDWNNVLFALGGAPNQKKFVPKTADITVLLANLDSVVKGFTKEMQDFCITHVNRRNSELHSGSLPFDQLDTAEWLPMFYVVCEVLVTSMGDTLEELLSQKGAEEAQLQIDAHRDDAAKAVRQNINAHKTIWEEFTQEVRDEKQMQATNAALKYFGHRVPCPACKCTGLVYGTAAQAPKTELLDEEIVVTQRMLPARFECMACELKIVGYSKLLACGLGGSYTSEASMGPFEYFNIDIEQEYHNMMAEDNNE